MESSNRDPIPHLSPFDPSGGQMLVELGDGKAQRILCLRDAHAWGTSVLDSPNPGISNHLPPILAVLGISAQDLALIRTYTNLADPDPLHPVPLTVASLSKLCRYAFLAQGLGLSVALIGVDPFQQNSATQTFAFVQAVQAVQASPFSIAQLNYLYLDAPEDKEQVLKYLELAKAKAARGPYWVIFLSPIRRPELSPNYHFVAATWKDVAGAIEETVNGAPASSASFGHRLLIQFARRVRHF